MNGIYTLSLDELQRLQQKMLDNECFAAADMVARAIKRKMELTCQQIDNDMYAGLGAV